MTLPAPQLFPSGSTVDRITPDGNAWCWVHVANRRTVRLHTRTVIDLDIKIGAEWTTELAEAARNAALVDETVSGLRKWLHARPRSRAEAAARLEAAQIPAPLAARALERLTASGEINDASVAEIERQTASRRGESEARLTQRWAERGLDTPSPCPATDTSGILDVAHKRAASFRSDLAWEIKARRLMAWLASRGYSEDEATDAVTTVLGNEPAEPGPGTLDP